jgi:hypothetical protein
MQLQPVLTGTRPTLPSKTRVTSRCSIRSKGQP